MPAVSRSARRSAKRRVAVALIAKERGVSFAVAAHILGCMTIRQRAAMIVWANRKNRKEADYAAR